MSGDEAAKKPQDGDDLKGDGEFYEHLLGDFIDLVVYRVHAEVRLACASEESRPARHSRPIPIGRELQLGLLSKPFKFPAGRHVPEVRVYCTSPSGEITRVLQVLSIALYA